MKGGQLLKEKDSEIVFAKVDGTEEEALRTKMKIEGYPTLYFYRQGEDEPIKYAGGRMAREMVEWVEKKTGPEAEPLATADDVDKVRTHTPRDFEFGGLFPRLSVVSCG